MKEGIFTAFKFQNLKLRNLSVTKISTTIRTFINSYIKEIY